MSSQPRTQTNPNSLANLLPAWKPGQSANPGGQRKGGNRVDVEYQRLLDMSADEAATFQPSNGAQIIAYKQFLEACSNKRNSLDYAKEITDRTSGKVADKLEVTAKYSEETRQAIVVEAYLLLFKNRSREESLHAINLAYDAIEAGDEEQARNAVQMAVQADSEAVAPFYAMAEQAITGESR